MLIKEGKIPGKTTLFHSWDSMFDYLSQNTTFSYTIAYTPRHAQHAMQRVVKFINDPTN